MRRALVLSATTTALLLGLTAAPQATAAETAAGPRPIVYVHGFGGSAAEFGGLKPTFEAAGYSSDQLYALDFANTQTNETTAKQLSAKVDAILQETGASQVDVLAFSMGGLSSRYYTKNLGGSDKVANLFSVAGPNHGTSFATLCWLGYPGNRACPQMAPGSSFLKALNADDETPGATAYHTTVSECDGTIDPPRSTHLNGAANTWTEDCVRHNATIGNKKVLAEVIAAFAS